MLLCLLFTSPFLLLLLQLLLHYNQLVEEEDMHCAEPQAKKPVTKHFTFYKNKKCCTHFIQEISNRRRFSSKYTKTAELLGPLFTHIFSVCAAAADDLHAGTSQGSSATPPSTRYAKNEVHYIAEHHKCDI